MALEITRGAATAGEEFHAAPAEVVEEDTIITQYAMGGAGPIPIDPTSGEGLDTGYAGEDSAPAQTAAEEHSVIA